MELFKVKLILKNNIQIEGILHQINNENIILKNGNINLNYNKYIYNKAIKFYNNEKEILKQELITIHSIEVKELFLIKLNENLKQKVIYIMK